MRYGITGHQERPGIDWTWVKQTLQKEITRYQGPIVGLSSLAKGADQVFAEAVLGSGGSLVAVIPRNDYKNFFDKEYLEIYQQLLLKSKPINLPGSNDHESDFLTAGVYIADNVDCLFAVWDGQPSKGKGGTADVVKHALEVKKEFVHINPFSREVLRANSKQH